MEAVALTEAEGGVGDWDDVPQDETEILRTIAPNESCRNRKDFSVGNIILT